MLTLTDINRALDRLGPLAFIPRTRPDLATYVRQPIPWLREPIVEGQPVPEILLPARFADLLHSETSRPPEHRLMLAILEEAIRCYQRDLDGPGRRSQRLFRETEDWFASDDTSLIGSWQQVTAARRGRRAFGVARVGRPPSRSLRRGGRPRWMIRAVTPLVLVLALAATAVAQDGPSTLTGPPLMLRLEGVIQPTREAAEHTGGFTVASFGFLDGKSAERRWLGVTEALTVDGDDQLGGKDVLDVVAPFQPSFLVAGPAGVMADVRDAPPGTALRIEGLVDGTSRTYYLRRVEREDGH